MIKKLRKIQCLVHIAGVSATRTTDVVAYNILLLLSKEAMKKANGEIDFEQDDKISIFGKIVDVKNLLLQVITVKTRQQVQ